MSQKTTIAYSMFVIQMVKLCIKKLSRYRKIVCEYGTRNPKIPLSKLLKGDSDTNIPYKHIKNLLIEKYKAL